MDCSQAVLMLMLLVPCEQSGGKSPETVIAGELRAAPVVQAEPAPDRRPPTEPVLPATTDAMAAGKGVAPEPVAPPERNSAEDLRVSD
jgi:hypothetical protein